MLQRPGRAHHLGYTRRASGVLSHTSSPSSVSSLRVGIAASYNVNQIMPSPRSRSKVTRSGWLIRLVVEFQVR